MGYKNILFDLDGTLTDSCSGIANSVRYAPGKFGIVEDNEDRLKLFVGPPLEKSFMEFYRFDRVKSKKAVEYYREYFSEKGIYENRPYGGIDGLLKYIHESGRMSLPATSKPEVFAQKILKHFDIEKYFHDVAGSSPDGTLAEKDEIIKYVIEKNSLNRAETIMVGDRKHDIIGAHKNSIHSIAVTYGYGSRPELEEAGPAYFCETVPGILEII